MINDFYSLYFSPEVMVKFTRRVTGHFVTLIESGMLLFECISGLQYLRAGCHIHVQMVSISNVKERKLLIYDHTGHPFRVRSIYLISE